MHVLEKSETGTIDQIGQELRYCCGKLPDVASFLGLLVAWCALFQFLGRTSAIAGQTSSLFDWMWDKWSDPAYDASHGKLIPIVVLGLLWYRRRQLVESVTGAWWPGLVGLGFALLLHVVGYIVQQPRLSMIALFSGAWMLTGVMWGPKTLRVTFFPFAIFGFCMPMGGTFAQGLTLPLRMMAAKTTEFITKDCLDVHVVREGTKLMDPNRIYGSFDVAAECSGIRSFTALLAITTILAVLTLKKLWKQLLLIGSSVPFALVFNVLRITTIILAANAFNSAAAGKFVDHYFGYLTYLMAVIAALLLARWLKEKQPSTS